MPLTHLHLSDLRCVFWRLDSLICLVQLQMSEGSTKKTPLLTSKPSKLFRRNQPIKMADSKQVPLKLLWAQLAWLG